MQLKYIEDYYDKIQERFPDLEMWEIKKILEHGFRSFFTLNSKGADVIIKSPHNAFTMYFGKLFNRKELATKYFFLKWKIKLRIKYLHAKPIYNGYYYFGLSEEDYKKYIPNKSGRIKKKIVFDTLWCFKIKEEAFLDYKSKYFFKIKLDEGKLVKKLENYSTRDIEMIAKRDSKNKIQYINE